MEKSRKFASYSKLAQALSRDKISNPGKMATFLLETFVQNRGSILRPSLEKRKLISPTSTMDQWRSQFLVKGWLIFERGEHYQRHYPGPKLVKYVNQEKLATQEVATTRELQQVKEDLNKCIREAFVEMINIKDPPADEEKIKSWIEKKSYLDHLKVVK